MDEQLSLEELQAKKPVHIPVRRGHVDSLRFWMVPVNRDIMNADADWLIDEELSCDNLCIHELFLPFILRYHKGRFKWKNEINLISFKGVRAMSADVRRVCDLLQNDYENPELDELKKHCTLDLLVSRAEYQSRYLDLSNEERAAAVRANIGVVIRFYTEIADWMDEMLQKYRPLGFNAIAVCAPH